MSGKLSSKLSFATPSKRGAYRVGKMYGILMESVRKCIIDDYGLDKWEEITLLSQVPKSFCMHENYDDQTMLQLAHGCSEVLCMSVDNVMFYYGLCFVKFCQSAGYYKILSGMGRHFHDFLHGIDELHENMRYSYPNMASPLFKVENEDENGCTLRYESQRTGFTYYVMGQLTGIATSFYGIDSSQFTITVLSTEQEEHQGSRVHYRLDFQNTGFHSKQRAARAADDIAKEFGSVHSAIFPKLFPFCIVFNEKMIVRLVGASLSRMFPHVNMVDRNLQKFFTLRRPQVTFSWENLMNLQNVVHELESTEELLARCPFSRPASELVQSKVILRGQMKYVEDWTSIAFLCRPLAGGVKDVHEMGLFLSDYSLFDRGREMALNNVTHSSTLEAAFTAHKKLAEEIQKVIELTTQHHQRSDELLNSMMPEDFAMRLKAGEKSPSRKYDTVTIMFSYLVGFKEVCEQAKPDIIVKSLNRVFDHFDPIIERHGLFKVETLGDAVYMVAGGVPDEIPDHAHRVAGLALELVTAVGSLTNPITGQPHSVRIGMHTGGVVAGVVGLHTPQYCLFGDTVNTASRMQSYSEPGRIHLSAPCRECLRDSEYVIVYRGQVNIKGKGAMKTYWLAGRSGEEEAERLRELFRTERNMQRKQAASPDSLIQFDLHSLHLASSSSTICTNFNSRHSSDEDEADADVIIGNGKLPLTPRSSATPPIYPSTPPSNPSTPTSQPSTPIMHPSSPTIQPSTPVAHPITPTTHHSTCTNTVDGPSNQTATSSNGSLLPLNGTTTPHTDAADPSGPTIALNDEIEVACNHSTAAPNPPSAEANHSLPNNPSINPESASSRQTLSSQDISPAADANASALPKDRSALSNHCSKPTKHISSDLNHSSTVTNHISTDMKHTPKVSNHTPVPSKYSPPAPSQPEDQGAVTKKRDSGPVRVKAGSRVVQHKPVVKPRTLPSTVKTEKRPSKPAAIGSRH